MALPAADVAKTGLTTAQPKSGLGSRLPVIVLYVVIITLAVLWLFPVVTMISSAMKSGDQIYLEPFPWQLPQPLALWENLQFAWTTGGLGAGDGGGECHGRLLGVGAPGSRRWTPRTFRHGRCSPVGPPWHSCGSAPSGAPGAGGGASARVVNRY